MSPEIDLEKLSPATREALERELKPKPDRRDAVAVNFTYDPDDEASVTKGYERGHLADEDLEQWGWGDLLAKLKKAAGAAGGDGGDGGNGDDEPPRRRGYFPSGS